MAAGYDEAPDGLVLESEMILRCEATEVLRSRTSEMLFEALQLSSSLPWLGGLCGCTVHLDPPRYSNGHERQPAPVSVKKPQMTQGELLP